MAFTKNPNKNILETTRRLKNSLRQFPAKTYNDMYHIYNMLLRKKEDISTFQRYGNRDANGFINNLEMIHKRNDPRYRDSKVRYEPVQGPCIKKVTEGTCQIMTIETLDEGIMLHHTEQGKNRKHQKSVTITIGQS